MGKHNTLHPQTNTLLRTLAAALKDGGDGWVKGSTIPLDEVDYFHRKQAQDKGYMTGRGNTRQREFHITDKGLALIGQEKTEPRTYPKLSATEKERVFREARQRVLAKKLNRVFEDKP